MLSKSVYLINILLGIAAVSLSVSISAMEIALGLLLIILIIFLFKKHIDVTSDCPYFLLFFVYWIATLLPFFFGSNYAVTHSNVFDIWPMLYIFVGYYFVRTKNIRLIILLLVFGSSALGISMASDVEIFNKLRADGFLNYMTGSNILALGATLSLAAVVSGYEKNKILISYYLVACLVMVIGILYTETRGPILSFLTVACFMLIFQYKLKGVFASICLILIVGVSAYFSGIGERFYEVFRGFNDVNTSHGWRLELWRQTITLVKDYPVFGVGNGAYEALIKKLLPQSNLPTSHAHNGYLAQLVLFGVVGFVAFCLFYGRIALDFIKKIRINYFAFIGFFVLLTYLLEGLTENIFQDSEVIMYCSFTLGIMLGAIKNQIGIIEK